MISVSCPNGHKLNAKEKLAGKTLKCPKCGAPIQIPEVELEPIEPELIAEPLEATELPSFDDLDLGNGELDFGNIDQTSEPIENTAFATEADHFADPFAVPDQPASTNQDGSTFAGSMTSGSAYAVASGNSENKQEEGTDRKALLVGGGAGGALGLLFVIILGWLLFSGDSTNNQQAALPPAPTKPENSEPKAVTELADISSPTREDPKPKDNSDHSRYAR